LPGASSGKLVAVNIDRAEIDVAGDHFLCVAAEA
jgi:hypothetical protein